MNGEKKVKAEKAEKVEKAAFSAKAANSTLFIKGLSFDSLGTFKLMSKMLNMKYASFLDLLMASYAEQNPIIEDHLSGRPIHFYPVQRDAKEQPYNPEAEVILAELERDFGLLGGKDEVEVRTGRKNWRSIKRKTLIYKIKHILTPFLSKTSVPDAQKEEIRAFIEAHGGGG